MVCGYVGAINCRLSQLMFAYLFEYPAYYPSMFLNYWYNVVDLNVSLHFFPWWSTCVYFRALINSFYLCSRLFRQADNGTRSKRNLVSLQSKVGISATQLSTSLVTKNISKVGIRNGWKSYQYCLIWFRKSNWLGSFYCINQFLLFVLFVNFVLKNQSCSMPSVCFFFWNGKIY